MVNLFVLGFGAAASTAAVAVGAGVNKSSLPSNALGIGASAAALRVTTSAAIGLAAFLNFNYALLYAIVHLCSMFAVPILVTVWVASHTLSHGQYFVVNSIYHQLTLQKFLMHCSQQQPWLHYRLLLIQQVFITVCFISSSILHLLIWNPKWYYGQYYQSLITDRGLRQTRITSNLKMWFLKRSTR